MLIACGISFLKNEAAQLPPNMSIWRQFIDTFLEVTESIPYIDISACSSPVYAGPVEVPDVSNACYAKRSGWPLSC